MDILTDLQGRLRTLRDSWDELALRTGISVHTIRKIAYGDRKNPRLDTIEPLLNDKEVRGAKAKVAA